MTRILLCLLSMIVFAACTNTGAPLDERPVPHAEDGEQIAAFWPRGHHMPYEGPISIGRVIDAGGHSYISLGRNAQGYQEFARRADGAEVVLVPGGYFHKRAYWDTPGTAERAEGEWLELPSFLMDKYEVTNAQVATFLNQSEDVTFSDGKATGPEDRPWAVTHQWGLKITEGGASVQSGFERHPAVGISGWLSLAYARWVGGDLPTGTEYEKAAAGPAGLLFPWGNEDKLPDSSRANSYLHGPKRTMPVGSYPAGVSPYGLHDMAGNTYSRAYWDSDLTVDDTLDLGDPTMLKGGAWVSPNWWNLRCVCRCGQGMDAMDGSVGLRVIVRDEEVLRHFVTEDPQLRVFTNTSDAYFEAESRNVPILLYLGFERCGQCDRVQAQLFKDPEFVAYCNENLVVLVGHSAREWNDLPKTPLAPGGIFFAHTNAALEEMYEVYLDFGLERDPRLGPLPDSIALFTISPLLALINPHRDMIIDPQDAVLKDERDLWSLKTGSVTVNWREHFEEAQAMLGPHLTHAQYEDHEPAPETTWTPTPEDEEMWSRALMGMTLLHTALTRYHDDHDEYPEQITDVRDYFHLSRLPQDPFTGRYFRYELTETGYRLTCYGKGDQPGGTEGPEKDIIFTDEGHQTE
jgi:formylglycine-generating enzyme required for sulfatase activity